MEHEEEEDDEEFLEDGLEEKSAELAILKNPNLYDLIIAKLSANKQKTVLLRTFMIFRLNSDVFDNTISTASGFFSSLMKHDEDCTGIALIYPTYVLWVIESAISLLPDVMRLIHDEEKMKTSPVVVSTTTGPGGAGQGETTITGVSSHAIPRIVMSTTEATATVESFRGTGAAATATSITTMSDTTGAPSEQRKRQAPWLSHAKILIISHNISERLFPQQITHVIDSGNAVIEESEYTPSDTDTVSGIILSVVLQLCKLGSYLSKTTKANLKQTLQYLPERAPNCFPDRDVINYLLDTEDKCMYTSRSFLDIYDKPKSVILESDIIWPAENNLFPLLQ